MTVGAPDWSGQRQLHGTEQLINFASGAIAPGTTSVKTAMVTRPGYLVELHVWNATDTVTSLPLSIQVVWDDAESGDKLDTQLWYVFAGTTVTPHYIVGSGPTRGGLMKLEITNNAASAVNLEYFLIVDQTSFSYARHDWRTDDQFGFSIPGHNDPTEWDSNASLLAGLNSFSLASGVTNSFVIGLYNGPVQVHADSSSATNQLEISFTMGAAPGGEANVDLFDILTPAAFAINEWFWAPRCEMLMHVHNAGSAQITINVAVVMGER